MSSDEESEMDEFRNKLPDDEANALKKDESISGDSKNGSFGNFKCEKCLRKFARKYSLHRHYKNVPNCGATREYACRFCPEICSNRDSLREHEMIHKRSSTSEATPIQTDDSKGSEEEEEEEEEEESNDSEDSEEEWPLKCLLCEKSFKSASDLRLHTVKAHNDDGVVADAFTSNRAKEAVLLRDTKDLEPKKNTEKPKPPESLVSKKPAPLDPTKKSIDPTKKSIDPTKKSKEKDGSSVGSSRDHSKSANREKLKAPNRDSSGTPNSVSHQKRPKESETKTSGRESLGGTHSANVSRKPKDDSARSANRHSSHPVKKFKTADGRTHIRESKTPSGSSHVHKSKESSSSGHHRSSKTSISSHHQLKRPKEIEGKHPSRDSHVTDRSHLLKKHKGDSSKVPSKSSKTPSSSSSLHKSKSHDHRPSNRDSKNPHAISQHKKSKDSRSKTDKPGTAERPRTTNLIQSNSVPVSNSSQIVHSSGTIPTQQRTETVSGMNVYPSKNENVVIIRNINPVNYSVPPQIISSMPAPNMVPVSSAPPAMLTSQVPYNHTQQPQQQQQPLQSGVNNTTVLPSLFNQVGVPSFQVASSNARQIVTHVEPNQQLILNDLMHSAPVNVQNPPPPNYYQTNDFNENVSLPAHIFSSDHMNINHDHNQMNAPFTNVNSPNVYLNHGLPPPNYVTPVQSNYAKLNPSHDVQMSAPTNYAPVSTNENYPVACNISMNEHVNLTQVGTYKRNDIQGQQTQVAPSLNFATIDNNQQQNPSGILQDLNCEGSPLAGLELGQSSSSHLTGGTFSQAVTVLSGPTMGVPNQQQTNQFYHNNYYNPVQNVPISTSGYMNTTPVYVNDNSGFSHQSYTNTNFFPNQNNTGQLNLDELVAMTPTNLNDQFNQNMDYPTEPLVYTDLSNSGGPVPNNNDSCDMPKEEKVAIAENAGNPDNKPIPCLVCDKSFFTKSGLRHHTKRYHPDHLAALSSIPSQSTFKPKVENPEKPKEKGPLQCMFCEKTFFTKCGMKAHTVKHHAQEFTPKTINQLTSKVKNPINNQTPPTMDGFHPPNVNTSTPTQYAANPVQGNAESNGDNVDGPAPEEIKMCKIDGVTFIYCLFCEKPFSTRSGLRWHTAKHHGADALEKTNNSLANVRISHLPEGHVRKYKKSNEKDEPVEKPIKKNAKYSKEPGGFFKCNSCEKCYSTNQGLKEHFERHHSGKPFVRANASKTSKLAAALTKTLGEENSEASTSQNAIKGIQCMFCEKHFYTNSGLRYHIKQNHREHYREDASMTVKVEGQFIGSEVKEEVNAACEEVSLNQSSHKSIPKNSIDNITMPCDICQQIFNDENIFDLHVKAHLDERKEIVSEKPVKCSYCDKIFPAKRSLVNHTIQKHREIFSKLNKKKAAIESNTQSDEGCKVKNEILASHGVRIDAISFHGESGRAAPPDKLPDGTIKTERDNEISAHQISFNVNARNETTFKKEFIFDESPSKLPENNQTPSGDNSKNDMINTIFTCHICKMVYNNKNSLRIHLRSHIPAKPIQCKFCSKILPSSLSLLRHTIIKHRKSSDARQDYKSFTLDDAQEKQQFEKLLQENDRKQPKRKTKPMPIDADGNPMFFSCQYCDLQFVTNCSLRKHLKKHSGDTVVFCKFCGKDFPGKISLLRHTIQNHKDMPQPTGEMDESEIENSQITRKENKTPIQSLEEFAYRNTATSSTAKSLDEIRSEPTEPADSNEKQLKSFNCKICNTVLENRKAWHLHVSKHFEEVPSEDLDDSKQQRKKTLTCKVCYLVLANRSAWHAHVRTHFKDVPSKCHVCHRMFPKRLSLVRHIFQMHKNISRQSLNFKFMGEPEEVIKTKIESNIQKKKYSSVPERSRLQLHGKNRNIGSQHIQTDVIIKSEVCLNTDTANLRNTRYGPGSCKLCNRHFASPKALHKHMLEHVRNPKGCKFCDRLFPNGRSLTRHAIQIHRDEVFAIRRKANIPEDAKYPLNWLRGQIEKEVKKEMNPVTLQDIDFQSENDDASSCSVSVYSSTTSESDQSDSNQNADSSVENLAEKKKMMKRASASKYTCKICNRVFYMKSLLIHHLVEHVKMPEVCPYCNKRYPSKKFLVRHKMKKHRSLATTSQANLMTQIKQVTGEGERRKYYRLPPSGWPCRMCTQSFRMKKELIAHMKEHYKQGPLPCPVCKKIFRSGLSLMKHSMSMHKNMKLRMMNTTDIPNADVPVPARKQRQYLDRPDPVDGETVCRICKAKFETTDELRVHWKTHKPYNRKPARCESCNIFLCSRESLRRHMFLIHKVTLPKMEVPARKDVTKEDKINTQKIPLVRILEKKDYIRDNIWSNDESKKLNYHQDFTNINADDLPIFDHHANDEYIRKMEEKMGLRDFFLDRIPLQEQNKIETDTKTNDEIKQDEAENKVEIDEKENMIEEIATPELFEGHKLLKTNFNKIFETNEDKMVYPDEIDHFEFYEYFTDVEANMQDDLFSEFLISDEKLKTNMDKFLKILLGEDIMRSFGWPEKSSDEVLSQIISKCGHIPAKHDDDPCDNTTHIRENMTLFFKFVVNNNVAKKLLYNHTVDQILMRILETAKEDDLKIEKTE